MLTLRVWTDGTDWIVAESAERAHALRAAHYDEDTEDMGDLDDWRALADDERLSMECEPDDCGNSFPIEKAAAEWIAHEGGKEGFLCSTEF